MPMDWQPLVSSFSEFVGPHGTLYSFRRITNADGHSDGKAMWTRAASYLKAVTRDMVLVVGGVRTSVVLVHGLAEYDTAQTANLLGSNYSVNIGHQWAGGDRPKTDDTHVNVFITGNTKRHCDAVVATMNSGLENDFLGVLGYHASVYMGKFSYDPYSHNENFYLTFPEGMLENACCYILTTFTKDAADVENRPLTSIAPRLSLEKAENTFHIRSEEMTPGLEYYYFKGVINERGESIKLDMYNPAMVHVSEINLHPQPHSTR